MMDKEKWNHIQYTPKRSRLDDYGVLIGLAFVFFCFIVAGVLVSATR